LFFVGVHVLSALFEVVHCVIRYSLPFGTFKLKIVVVIILTLGECKPDRDENEA